MATPAYRVSEAIEDTSTSFQSLFKVSLSNNALATWQNEAVKAIEIFLKAVQEKVVQSHSLSSSSLLISYVPGADQEIERSAAILKHCFTVVGIPVTVSPLTTSEALSLELNQYQQAIVLCTPLYAERVAQEPAIHTVLDSFGKKSNDSLHTLLCQGTFSDALKVVDGHFLIRTYQEAFSDNTYNALQTFIDVFLEVSGNQGLGILPDVLDLEKNEQFDTRANYLRELTVLHQAIIQITIDYRLRESMEKIIETHPLKSYLDVKALPTIKTTPGFEPIVQELLDTPAKVSLLLCPTAGDTELAGLALSQHFSGQKDLRVLSIECADYPGKAAADCVRLAFEEMKLKTVHLDAAREKPLIILLKGYEQFGVYDNLVVKNKLSSFVDVKVVITCKADFFKFRGYLSCFLSDVSNRRVEDILAHKVPGFASADAKAFALSITRQPRVLETTEAVLLSPKRRAQQEELKNFSKNLNQIWVREDYLQPDTQQNSQIFVSYAWQADKASLARQQRHLLQLSQELTALGFPTWLDIERMTGNIDEQMAGNIANSRVVLVIGTPRYTERAAQSTNVQKEFAAIIKKAARDPNFRIFPLEFLNVQGQASFPSALENHSNHCDFTGIDEGSDYLQRMTDPDFGLIPRLLLDTPAKKALYQTAYADFQEQLQLLVGKHLIVNQGQDDIQAYDMDNRLKGYIEPFGLYNEASPLDSRFDLQKHFQSFLDKPDSKTAIVLGRAGSGKSLFALSTFKTLLQPWHEYRKGAAPLPAWLPIYIQLRNYANDPEHCIENALRQQFGLTVQDIEALKQGLNHNQRILFICDGFDELGSGVYPNLSQSASDLPLAKVLVTGRPEHFDRDHQPLETLSLRSPDGRMIFNSAEVVYISPFSLHEIQRYVAYYDKGKNEDTYQTLEKLPGMMVLLDNPFLLTLVLQSLPQLLKNREGIERAVTRTDIYQAFTETWFLQETKGRELDPKACQQFNEELAFRLFQERTLSVVPKSEDKPALWTFFSSDANQAVQDASPLRFSGGSFSFVHTTIYAYFVALFLWKALSKPGCVDSWQVRPLTEERAIIDFLAELYQISNAREDIQTCLFELIENSRRKSFPAIASSNASTVLNTSGVPFSGRDLHDIRIPGADLTGAILDNTNLENSDLSNATLFAAWLHGANLKNTLLRGLELGEYPSLSLEGNIFACRHSANGRILGITTSKNIQLFDASTRVLLRMLEDHTNSVTALSFSPDSEFLASGSMDNTVKIWRVTTGECLHTFKDHTGSVLSVNFNPEGNIVASGSSDKTIRFWDVTTGTCLKILEGHMSPVTDVSFNSEGNVVASGSSDKTIRFWDVTTGTCLNILEGHMSIVTSICFSPSGRHLVSAGGSLSSSQDEMINIKLWDVGTGACIKTLKGHTHRITKVIFSPDEKFIASGSSDRTAKLWDVKTGVCLKTLEGFSSFGFGMVSFSPDNESLVVGIGKIVKFWNIRTFVFQPLREGHRKGVSCVSFSSNGKLIASGSGDRTIKIWSTTTRKCLKTLNEEELVTSVNFSPDEKLIVSGSWDNKVKIWDVATGVCLKAFEGHSSYVECVNFNSGGNLIVSGSSDQLIKIWEVSTGRCLNTFEGHTSKIQSVSFSPNGKLIASGSWDKKVKIWDVATGVCLNTFEGPGYVENVTFNLEGNFIALAVADENNLLNLGGKNHVVQLWDLAGSTCLKTLEGHTGGVNGVTFSPDSQYLISASRDNTIRLWDNLEAEKITNCHVIHLTSQANSVTFSKNLDSIFLVSGHYDGSVRYWKLIEVEDKPYLQLIWSSSQNTLLSQDANLEGVKGLSINNRDLLKQRGAIGDSLELEPAEHVEEISVTSPLKSSTASVMLSTLSDRLLTNVSPEQPLGIVPPVAFSVAAQSLITPQESRGEQTEPVVAESANFNDILRMWQSRGGGK